MIYYIGYYNLLSTFGIRPVCLSAVQLLHDCKKEEASTGMFMGFIRKNDVVLIYTILS